jgi:hypothetical protein
MPSMKVPIRPSWASEGGENRKKFMPSVRKQRKRPMERNPAMRDLRTGYVSGVIKKFLSGNFSLQGEEEERLP